MLVKKTTIFNRFVTARIRRKSRDFPVRQYNATTLRNLLLGLLLVAPIAPVCSANAETTPASLPKTAFPPGLGEYENFTPKGDIRRFAGETLRFNISFLIFPNAAQAEVKFFEKGGRYHSLLVAETKGFIGFLTAYRKHVYRSTFDLINGDQRVRTSRFEREVINGADRERTLHILDYDSRNYHWFFYRNDVLVEQNLEKIPDGVYYDDILAAFYNFRNSVYGDLEKGRRYKIDTIPDKSMKFITAYILTDQEREAFARQEGKKNTEGLLLLKAVIPKDVFKTKTGELVFWASKHYIPLETTVKDYVLLGDLHAEFAERIYDPTGKGLAPPRED